ncbi:hypothetical protein THRCLA_00646 [Thraustotheca clavata]|uniref:Secreted protein n=1 Tax=Thraustotheca clavata TaxID=74557 RepID=A0A1W0AAY2_9STRA|nr:hypothetical protein THRCLA_00646 [Thraustotheca clavata]
MLAIVSLIALVAAAQGSPYGVSQRTIKFPPPFKSLDPAQHKTIFANFKSCVGQCVKDTSYDAKSYDAWSALSNLGSYTACATTCVATEVLNTVGYYKSAYATIYDVYANHLVQTKKHLAGGPKFDFIGNRSRVDYSCCLPDEYFVPWDQVSIETFAFFQPQDRSYGGSTLLDDNGFYVNVRAEKYLEYCAQVVDGNGQQSDFLDDASGFGGLRLYCDTGLFYYLLAAKRNIGQQILHPSYAAKVPNGACTKRTNCDVTLKPNPKGRCFEGNVCVAQKTQIVNATGANVDSDDRCDYLTDLLVTKPSPKGTCDKIRLLWDNQTNYWLEIDFIKANGNDVDLYKVENLTRYDSLHGTCNFTGTLGTADINSITALSNPSLFDIPDWLCTEFYEYADYRDSNNNLYHGGSVEYCNAQQYANHLTRELYDYTECPFYDSQLTQDKSFSDFFQHENTTDIPFNFFNAPIFNPAYSIACLYRVVSLKCDCMRAVVNCYANENHFTTALGQTLGRASSILCGFILCQQPGIYRMFADADGIRHTLIMKEILMQTNLLDASSTTTIASTAFLSFGLGMIAFIAVKKFTKKNAKSAMEDGYRNLI